jgi:nicotinate-nucleotide adenylyltransferase
MVELACEGHPELSPSRLEEGDQKSYSIDTIGRIAREPEDTLFFIIGADAFAEIQTWKRWRDVIASVDFIVVSRPGHDYEIPEGARVHHLSHLQLPYSSTAIRNAIAHGQRPAGLSDPVWSYIVQEHLYAR